MAFFKKYCCCCCYKSDYGEISPKPTTEEKAEESSSTTLLDNEHGAPKTKSTILPESDIKAVVSKADQLSSAAPPPLSTSAASSTKDPTSPEKAASSTKDAASPEKAKAGSEHDSPDSKASSRRGSPAQKQASPLGSAAPSPKTTPDSKCSSGAYHTDSASPAKESPAKGSDKSPVAAAAATKDGSSPSKSPSKGGWEKELVDQALEQGNLQYCAIITFTDGSVKASNFELQEQGVANVKAAIQGHTEAIDGVKGLVINDPLPHYHITKLEENVAVYAKPPKTQEDQEITAGCVILKSEKHLVLGAYEKNEEPAIQQIEDLRHTINQKHETGC